MPGMLFERLKLQALDDRSFTKKARKQESKKAPLKTANLATS